MTNEQLLNCDKQIHAEAALRYLSEAIVTMRSFLADAQRAVEANGDDPARAVEVVMHQFAWGSANASSSIESALSSARKHDKAVAKLEAH